MKRLIFSMVLLLTDSTIGAQDTSDATERLSQQSRQFEERIIQVADNVYTAVGFKRLPDAFRFTPTCRGCQNRL